MVFDIVIDLDDICKYAQLIGVLGIIKYNTLYFARNNNKKKLLKSLVLYEV